jgi:hypothetical protein
MNDPSTVDANAEQFVWFCQEREAIRLRKEAGEPPPWTDDPVLRDGRFCCVRRSDDRVSRWIGEWLQFAPKESRWFWCAVARWFNEPRTLFGLTDLLQDGWQPDAMCRRLDEIKAANSTLFRPAYIIAALAKGKPKHYSGVEDVLTPLWDRPPAIVVDSIRTSWVALRRYPGQGSFMAGQVVADWDTFGVIHGADRSTWAPIGPGSARGLEYIYGRKFDVVTAVPRFRELHAALTHYTPFGASLSLMDCQNCLCEFAKWRRGYTKQKYAATSH